MGNLVEMAGRKFGKLTVLRREGSDNHKNAMWLCSCDCGGMPRAVVGSDLRAGKSKSCGCVTRTHGMRFTREYEIWTSMKQRCGNKNHQFYHHYGGRGITVCDRWLDSFENFFLDLGPKTAKGYSLERVNNNLGYTPENCKWATQREQTNNRRVTVFITARGKTMSQAEWARELGVIPETLGYRRRHGWTDDQIINIPRYGRGK